MAISRAHWEKSDSGAKYWKVGVGFKKQLRKIVNWLGVGGSKLVSLKC